VGFYPFAASSPAGGSSNGGISLGGLGMLIATQDIGVINTSSTYTLTAAQLSLFLCTAPVSGTITHLGLYLSGAGTGTPSGDNGLAVYSAAGVLLSKAATMPLTSLGWNEAAPLASIPVVAGTDYYLAMLATLSGTAPVGLGDYNLLAVDAPVPGKNTYPAIQETAVTTFPASFVPSALTPIAALSYCYGR
jgi:hypothetical protein